MDKILTQMNIKSFLDGRTKFVLLTLTFVFLYIVACSFFSPGWVAAAILSYGVFAVLVVYSFIKKDTQFQVFLLFSMLAGFTELLADYWLVKGINDLEYASPEPLLVVSPAYMPFAWAVVLSQIGFIGWRLVTQLGMLKASIIIGIVGGIIIPVYEHSAKGAAWWVYNDWTHEFWNAPYYIILGEALICMVLPWIFEKINNKKWMLAAGLGVLHGLWIFISYYLSYLIVG